MTADEERAFREGQVEARLNHHAEQLRSINGSVSDTGRSLIQLEKTVDRLVDQVAGVLLVLPKFQQIADAEAVAEKVAETLAAKTQRERSTWERYRGITAWTLASLIACVTIFNMVAHVFI